MTTKIQSLIVPLIFSVLCAGAIADEVEDPAVVEARKQEAFRAGVVSIVNDLNYEFYDSFIDAVDQAEMIDRIYGLRLIDQRIKKQFEENVEASWPGLIKGGIIPGRGVPEDGLRYTLLGVESRGDLGRAVVRVDLENFQLIDVVRLKHFVTDIQFNVTVLHMLETQLVYVPCLERRSDTVGEKLCLKKRFAGIGAVDRWARPKQRNCNKTSKYNPPGSSSSRCGGGSTCTDRRLETLHCGDIVKRNFVDEPIILESNVELLSFTLDLAVVYVYALRKYDGRAVEQMGLDRAGYQNRRFCRDVDRHDIDSVYDAGRNRQRQHQHNATRK